MNDQELELTLETETSDIPSEDISSDETPAEAPEETSGIEEAEEAEKTEENELDILRNEVKSLRAQLEEKTAIAERISAELGELAQLFPEVTPNAIPEEVWADVRNGTSLAAAYALYERRVFIKDQRTNAINAKNARLSSGKAGSSAIKEFFSPDEVRAMSQSEVRANYSKIIESMKKWN